uniref:hypothetical protein n=1 Tax=Jannaschia marina TaxID=2741674 RepID=UPI0038B323F7
MDGHPALGGRRLEAFLLTIRVDVDVPDAAFTPNVRWYQLRDFPQPCPGEHGQKRSPLVIVLFDQPRVVFRQLDIEAGKLFLAVRLALLGGLLGLRDLHAVKQLVRRATMAFCPVPETPEHVDVVVDGFHADLGQAGKVYGVLQTQVACFGLRLAVSGQGLHQLLHVSGVLAADLINRAVRSEMLHQQGKVGIRLVPHLL